MSQIVTVTVKQIAQAQPAPPSPDAATRIGGETPPERVQVVATGPEIPQIVFICDAATAPRYNDQIEIAIRPRSSLGEPTVNGS